ncbi:MAG TPA: class I SAM-dependent methyltransferase, partial [Caulifigura sp.]|nr:class I SAM-dependent methyltransferase [Caulifigura sp.]
ILLKHLADRGFEAHGFEVSEAAAEGVDPRIHLRIASDLAAAGYPESYFDQIIIWHVFEHVSDPRSCLEEMRRIVKPGGEVVVAVPNFSSPQACVSGPAWFHLDLPRHLFHFPVEALKRLLESTGFEVVSEHHFSLRQNPFGWVQSVLNRLPGLPRNGLYELLHNHRQRSQFPLAVKLVLWMAFVAGMPLGLAIEVVAAALKRGATVHVVARRLK